VIKTKLHKIKRINLANYSKYIKRKRCAINQRSNLLNKHGTYQQAGDRSDAALLPEELIEKKKLRN
jgi:hypothetical protein